jgi:O-antigen ligase/tetratricopeptide (TPR) repeat protein
LSLLYTLSLWVSAVIIAVLPFAVAADFGGVLRWTQYAAAFPILLAALLALPALRSGHNSGRARQMLLLAPILIWLIFACLQTVSLPPSLVGLLSPASHAAYTEWITPLLPSGEALRAFPISVSVPDSMHAIALAAMLVPLCWAASLVFYTRARVIMLMSAIAVGSATLAAFGIARLAFPGASFFEFTESRVGAPFGTFVNRNNASLMLNIGLAASLGLLSWRLTALVGQQVDEAGFEFNDLLALIGERESAIGMLGAAFCSAGLLACGSRSGLAAAVLGAMLALGWVRKRRGLVSIPVVLTTIAVAVAILVTPLKLRLSTIERLEFFNSNARTVMNDGRFAHWPEGWNAAIAHLPAGSGLATYGYAYRPFQESGVAAWCKHADNLWLEMLTEQGLIGGVLTLLILFLFARSLNRLRGSPDALDQGIQTMGWYCIGAILVSQAFDFGLIIPANLFLMTIIVSMVIARNAANATWVSTPSRTKTTASDESPKRVSPIRRFLDTVSTPRTNHATLALLPLLVAVVSLVSIRRLHRDAHQEYLVCTANMQLEANRTDKQTLDRLADDMAEEIDNHPSPELLNALAAVEYNRARLAEVEAARPRTFDQAAEYYLATGPTTRRLLHRRPNGSSADDQVNLVSFRQSAQDESYRPALDLYALALRLRPFDIDARFGQVDLDFVEGDSNRTEALLTQLGTLLHNTPQELIRLGRYAAESGHGELASRLWHTALIKDPNSTRRVMGQVRQYAEIHLADVIPNEPRVMRAAASMILRNTEGFEQSFLATSLEGLDCGQCQTNQQRADCLELSGDIAFALDRQDRAFQDYDDAINRVPDNANLRIKLIGRLRQSGRQSEARQQARSGRLTNRSDERFDQVIADMAKEDLEQLQQ